MSKIGKNDPDISSILISLKEKCSDSDHSVSCKSCGKTCWVTNTPEHTEWTCWWCNAYLATIIGTKYARTNKDGDFDPIWCRMFHLKDITTELKVINNE